jgi:hypothetical protein
VAAVAQVLRSKKGITAIGNAQVSTAQSKFGGASLALDGTGDRLDIPYSSDLTLSTTNWTVEYWIRITSQTGGYTNTIGMWDDTTADGVAYYFSCNMYDTTRAMGVQYFYGGNNSGPVVFGSTLTTGTWQHHAFVKNGNTLTAYKDGVSQGTHDMTGKTISPSNQTNLTSLKIGGLVSGGYLNGYMDEIRISNSARYTTTFTPSTTPFVNDDNTVLLIHANGTNASTFFEDDNGVRTSIGLSAAGNAQLDTAQSKFGGSALLFDGTGDYVTCATPTSAFNFGTGNFTIEFWIRLNATGVTQVPIAGRYSGSIFPTQWWAELTPDNGFYWGFKNDAGYTWYPGDGTATTPFASATWYHIALVRNGSTLQMYRNGTAYGAAQTGITGSFGYDGDIWVGALGPGGYGFNGWIDEVRVSKTARYTTTFTPSTTPFVNDTNTSVLIHANGTDASTVFLDDNGVGRAAAGIYRVNGPVISTAQSKFGGSSLYFNETSGQEVNVGYDTIAQGLTNNGDFTIEAWVYFTKTPNLGDTGYMMLYSHNPEPYVLFTANQVALGAGGYPAFTRAGSANFATNTWYHIAVSRSSGNLRCFENGTQIGSTVTGSTYNYIPYVDNLTTRFGKFGDDRGRWQGYMDEIRFSKTARYTANFSVATAPFQNDANTLLLIHGDGTNNSTVFTDDNGIAPYTP